MRRILFKAKKLSDSKWVKGSLVKTPFGTFIEWYEDSICNKREVDPNTVCQSTGLEDCEGKEIWEGDIVKYKDTNGERKGIINWNEELTAFCFGYYFLLCHFPSGNMVVIGNKFDKKGGKK